MARTILIVEDDVALANLYKTELETNGYTVIHVAEGVQALDSIKQNTPDLVLLDIMLPGKNGLEILQDMRADDALKEAKVIMLTNFGNEENVSTALELGALDYVMKYKITPSEMSAKIASLLGDTTDSVVKVMS
ncbi:response regulator [candidate division WWE3 bacterium]|jgi:DNA-binding response OmpR family regulator|nr:response regulator [candidate division WWE3 bacterium]MBT7349438.1 response regulator [candidate division WWE3 bacterium]